MPTEPQPAESDGEIAEQFVVPGRCLCLLQQRPADPQLRAIELLSRCQISLAPHGPDLGLLTLRCCHRRGDPRAAERLLNALLSQRHADCSSRLLPLPLDIANVNCAVVGMVEDILRGSSFIHCCGLAYVAFNAEAAAVKSILQSCSSSSTAELEAPAAASGCPVRSAASEWRLAAPDCRDGADYLAAALGSATACDEEEEEEASALATVPPVPTIRAARDGENAQLPPPPLIDAEADEAAELMLLWRPVEAAGVPTLGSSGSHFRPSVDPRQRRMLAEAAPWSDWLANSRCIGSEMLTQF